MSDTEVEVCKFPVDPKMPHGDILLEIFSRLTAISDAIHSPHGTLQVRLAAQEDLATKRNIAQMNILRKIVNEVSAIKQHLTEIDETVDAHDAKLTIMKHAEIQ